MRAFASSRPPLARVAFANVIVFLSGACILPSVTQRQDSVQASPPSGNSGWSDGSIAEQSDSSSASDPSGADASREGRADAGTAGSPNTPDACSPPCAHGVCRAFGSELSCDCSGTTWSGSQCESPVVGACATDNGGCEQVCRDESGRARCACNLGAMLAPDGTHCVGWRQADKLQLSVSGATVMESTLTSNDALLFAWAALSQPAGQMAVEGEVASTRWSLAAGWDVPTLLTTVSGDDINVQMTLRANQKGDAILLHRWWTGPLIAHVFSGSQWSAPSQLDFERFRSGMAPPSLVLDDQSNAQIVFARLSQDMTRTAVHGTSYVKGRGWAPIVQIEDDSVNANVNDPQMAMSPSGNVHLLWSDFRNRLFAKRWTAQTGWSNSTQLIGEDSIGRGAPRVTVSANGEALAIWTEGTDSFLRLMASTYSESTLWSTPSTLFDRGPGARGGDILPQLSMNPKGDAVVVWRESQGPSSRTWAQNFSVHGGWGTATEIGEESEGSGWDSPSVAVDAAGNATVAWLEHDAGRLSVRANRFTSGSGWGTAVALEADRSGDARSAHAAITSAGISLVSWITINSAGSGNTMLWIANWQPGT